MTNLWNLFLATADIDVYMMDQDTNQTGNEQTLFYDTVSKRYFYSDIEFIKHIIEYLNCKTRGGCSFVTLNEFYDAIGLESTEMGYVLGWDYGNDVGINYKTEMVNDNAPCIILDYELYRLTNLPPYTPIKL